MKMNELRVGNFYINDLGDVAQVLEIEGGGVVGDTTEYGKFTDENLIKPVKLTEEWLFKFGFKKSSDSLHYCESSYHILDDGFNVLFTIEYWNSEKWRNHWYQKYNLKPQTNKLKYVHQLQNLYFALTGEELTDRGLK